MNGARYFQRREEYQPPQTPNESPFRKFTVKCLKCGSYQMRLRSQFDEASEELALVLVCTPCRQQETLPVRWT